MQRSDMYGALPGMTAASETYENRFAWGKDGHHLLKGEQISGAARDPGNTPTTVLRPGLLLGRITSSGLLKEYDPASTDGSQLAYGALMSSFRMQDLDGNNTNKLGWVLVAGPVQAANLIGLDNMARNALWRFIFDDDLPGRYGRGEAVVEVAKTTSYTVLSSDAGTLFTTTGAGGAVVFTLPALAAGLGPFEFLNTVDQNMTVTAPAGKLITFNNAAATSVIFSTAGNKIGAHVRLYCNRAGTFYYMENLSPGNTITVA